MGKTSPRVAVPVSEEDGEVVTHRPERLSDGLATALWNMGVRSAFGIVGGAVAPLAEALKRSQLRLLHFRHESGAAFAAVEESLVTGRPVVVFVTTGPGLTNALTGISAARWEGAKVIVLTGTTPPAQQGRWALQETSAQTTPHAGMFVAGPLLHYGISLTDPLELRPMLAALEAGCRRPGGFVANIGIPISVQSVAVDLGQPARSFLAGGDVADATARRCAALLLDDEGAADRHPFCIWAGFGARNARTALRELAERTGVGVMCTPRAKGILPEDHQLYVGVSGFAGHAGAQQHIARHRPLRSLVLGTRLGEFSSLWDRALVPERGFIHVDIDATVAGAAFPDVPVVAVQAEVGAFLEALLDHVPAKAKKPTAPTPLPPPAKMTVADAGPVRPQLLFDAIQRVVVDDSNAVIMADGGNSFAWGIHLLRFREARFRVSVGFASMGHASSGVVGLAHAAGDKAVAIVGDGSMLMLNEISTAVQYGLPAVWIVLNDGFYGMVEQGMRRHGLTPVETRLPQTDFCALGKAMGASGIRVEREVDLDAALRLAMTAAGPFVVDVVIDPAQEAPIKGRVGSLIKQENAKWQ